MVASERGEAKDEVLACPTPIEAPPPLMKQWLELIDDKQSVLKPGISKDGGPDAYYLLAPTVEDMLRADVPHNASPRNPYSISQINGDRYENGNRVAYFGKGILDDGKTMWLSKVDFGGPPENSFVAKQTVFFAQIQYPSPVETQAYKAEFDKDRKLTSFSISLNAARDGVMAGDFNDSRRKWFPAKCLQ